MENQPISLPASVLAQISTILASGSNLYQAYDLILPFVPDGDDREFWFDQASLINRFANDPTNGVDPSDNLASTYIIAHSAYGLKLDGKTANLANTSNAIATRVLSDVILNGGVRPLPDMLQDDISAALSDGGQTIGGWGGSFYYWDLSFNGSTVGGEILSNAAELEKFLAASTVATAAVVYQELGEGPTFNEARTAISAAIDAALPDDLKAELITRTIDTMFYGQVFADVHDFGEWRYEPTTDQFVKYVNGSQVVATGPEHDFLSARLDYRLDAEIIPRSDYIDEVINDLDLGFTIGRPQECFPAGTLIRMWDGSDKVVEEVTTSDVVLSFDTRGNAVPGFVDKTFSNTTSEFAVLSFADGRDDLVATPGHRFLTETGDYMEIGHMLRLGGGTVRLTDRDGSIVEATGEVIAYSAETAHLFPASQTKSIAMAGNTVLKEQVTEGWGTYNFEVREHHNYVAQDVRVHNDSVLTLTQPGDVLVALNDDLTDAAVLRDVTGDGVPEYVVLDGVRNPGFDTRLEVAYVYTPSAADAATGVEEVLEQIVAARPELAGHPLDPGNGNDFGDGIISDDLDEVLRDDRGWTRTESVNGTTIPTLAQITADPLSALAVVQPILDIVNNLAPATVNYSSGEGDVSYAPFVAESGTAFVAAILGIDLGFELVPAVTIDGPFGPIEVTPAVTLGDLIDGAVDDQEQFTIGFGDGIAPEDVTRAQDGDDLVLSVDNSDGTTSTLTYQGVYADGSDSEVAGITFADGTQSALAELSETGSEPTNTAPVLVADEALSVERDGSGTSVNVLANDTDADGDTLSITGTPSASNGSVVNNGDGTLSYTPNAGFTGSDTITYQITDGTETIAATLDVTVSAPANAAPVSVADPALVIDQDTSGISVNVLANDTDADGDALSITGTPSAANGSVVDNGNGTLTYTPNIGFTGSDTITYQITDGTDTTSTTLDVTVNAPAAPTTGDDVINGTAGNDNVDGLAGNDALTGAAGNDTLRGNDGSDRLDGGIGNDLLEGGKGADTLMGGNGDDVLRGNHGSDVISGGEGNDYLGDWSGWSALDGGAGNDTLSGGAGGDTLTGGTGSDVFLFTSGQSVHTDIITDFEIGSDLINLDWLTYSDLSISDGSGGATVDYGDGDVIVLNGVSASSLNADSFVLGVEPGQGTEGNDTLNGSNGADVLFGYGGKDKLRGNNGADELYGGDGNDNLHGGHGKDYLSGGAGNDRLGDWSGWSTLDGGSGNDKLYAGAGEDRLIGGAGKDQLTGGKHADTFVFEAGDGEDIILDFADGQDQIEFAGLNFSDLTITQDGSNARIDYGNSDMITVNNIGIANLTEDDFIFV